jgi:hypothetical protein
MKALMKDPFVKLDATKDPFVTLGLMKDPFINRRARRRGPSSPTAAHASEPSARVSDV